MGERMQKGLRLMPFQGSFQLTFFNQFQLDATTILDLFNRFGATQTGSKVYSCLKRRCYIHYKTEQEALEALQGLKDNKVIYNLAIATDCIKNCNPTETKDAQLIYANLGTYDLTFSTSRRVDVPSLREVFGEFGSVDLGVTDFRSGHSRVFVKFRQRSSALAALSSLRSTFKDLGIAKNCAVDNVNKVNEDARVPDRDGLFCVRFKNLDECGARILERSDIIELFNEFGAVQSVHQDHVKWCYVRYNEIYEAVKAVSELQAVGHLPCVEHARSQENSEQLIKKRIKNPPAESSIELYISNYSRFTPARKLRKFFTIIHPFDIREMIVEGPKAYSFAKVASYEDLKRAVALHHNKVMDGRKVKVMAKLPHIQAKIMEELDKQQSCTINISPSLQSEISADDPVSLDDNDEDAHDEDISDNFHITANKALKNQLKSSRYPHVNVDKDICDRVSRKNDDFDDDDEDISVGFCITADKPVSLEPSIDDDDQSSRSQNQENICDLKDENDLKEDLESTIEDQNRSTELVIANFSDTTSESDIAALFGKFKIESIAMKVTKVTYTEPFTYATVIFKSTEEALDAITQFDGSAQLGADNLILEFNL